MCGVTARQSVRQQTSAAVHTQPVITSPPVPVTSARGPVTSAPVPMTSAQGPVTSQQRNSTAAAATMQSATTADSMTYSRTTLYVLNSQLVSLTSRQMASLDIVIDSALIATTFQQADESLFPKACHKRSSPFPTSRLYLPQGPHYTTIMTPLLKLPPNMAADSLL